MTDDKASGRDDATTPMLAYRMSALERRVDAGFRHIDERLDNLGFVRSDVYLAEKTALDNRLTQMNKEIGDARRPGIWALSVVGGAFLVALVGFLVQIAMNGPS